jgi:hypothetical protein
MGGRIGMGSHPPTQGAGGAAQSPYLSPAHYSTTQISVARKCPDRQGHGS